MVSDLAGAECVNRFVIFLFIAVIITSEFHLASVFSFGQINHIRIVEVTQAGNDDSLAFG